MARLPFRLIQSNASGRKAKRQVLSLLETGKLTLQPGLPRLFVCGGPTTTNKRGDKPSHRQSFLKWVNRRNVQVQILLAEEMYPFARSENNTFLNLGLFEGIIADLADCILIFCESAGAFAELGVFSTSRKICKKTFVSIEQAYHANDSFLALGPIAAIQSEAVFGTFPILRARLRDRGANFEVIWAKIAPQLTGYRETSVVVLNASRPYDLQSQLSLILLVIKIFRVITFGDLIDFVRESIFPIKTNRVLEEKLTVLIYFKQIRKVAGNLFVFVADNQFPMTIDNAGGNILSVSAYCVQFYQTHFPSVLAATGVAP